MREQEGTQNLVFLENDAAEATFPDNSSDIGEKPGKQYEENYWRKYFTKIHYPMLKTNS